MFNAFAIILISFSTLALNVAQARVSKESEWEKKIRAEIASDNSQQQGDFFYLKYSIVTYARVEVETKNSEKFFRLSCFSLGNGNGKFSDFEEIPSLTKSEIGALHERAVEMRKSRKSSFGQRLGGEIDDRGLIVGPFIGLIEGFKSSPYMKDDINYLKQLSNLMDKSLAKGTIVKTESSPCGTISRLQ